MNNSLKAGIISGLIAGVISAIVYEIFNNVALSLGFFEPWYRPLYTGNLIAFIPFFGLFGIILGVIYSKVYDIIPKKSIWKGTSLSWEKIVDGPEVSFGILSKKFRIKRSFLPMY